jgi:hypothetical protein
MTESILPKDLVICPQVDTLAFALINLSAKDGT